MLSLITFEPDKNVEKKVNFFCDYFNLATNHVGKYPCWDFENPLSIVDKIIFQIENNPENRDRYLTNHLKNYHFQKNGYTDQFKALQQLRPLIDSYLKVKRKNKWLNKNPKFLLLLQKLKIELEKDMYNTAVDYIINYLRCKHNIDHHKNDFKYLIQIIVSELKFKGKSKRDVNRLIHKIMSKNVKEFPLPQIILTEQNKEIFNKLSSDFMSGRTFTQQFEGIKNFNENQDFYGYFILKIHRLQLDQIEILSFDDVRICNPQNEIFDNFVDDKIEDQVSEHWRDFVHDDNISLAITQGNLSNYDSGLKSAIIKVQEFVNYINNKLETNCYVNIYNHRSTPNFQRVAFGFKSDTTQSNLSKREIEKLNLDNPFERLNKVSSQAKNKLLAAEKFYQRALISNEPSDYWHYLECLIPKERKDGKYIKQVKSVASAILFVASQNRYPTHLANCIFNLLNGRSRERTRNSLAYGELNKITQNWSNSNILKIAKSFSHHPIIESLISDYNNRQDKELLLEVYQIYYYMFNELYEIRNAYIHSGIKNEYSNKKVQMIIPMYINTIRSFLLDKIEYGRVKKIETILKNVKLKANKVLPVTIDDDGITPSS